MRIKVDVADLQPGMFVAELDRPWLDSPFLFQGFVLDDDHILEVRQICRWVLVEDTKSRGNIDFAALEQKVDQRAVEDYREVAKRAAETSRRAREQVAKALDDIRLEHSVNVHQARAVVDELVDSVASNANAALWLTTLKKRHERTGTHCLNTCILALSFARHLGYPENELQEIGLGALLHDVGIARVPQFITDKPGPLEDAEWQLMRTHPVEGKRIMGLTGTLSKRTLDIILHHHERIDGSGYPDRLKGDEVDRTVRIVAICDTYDTMTTDQPYRQAILPQLALTQMLKTAGDQLGRDLIEEFIRCIGIYPIGSLVRLSTGALALVMSSDPEARLKPMVMMVRDADGDEVVPRQIINLHAVARARRQDPWTIVELLDHRELGIDVERMVESEVAR